MATDNPLDSPLVQIQKGQHKLAFLQTETILLYRYFTPSNCHQIFSNVGEKNDSPQLVSDRFDNL